MPDSTLGLTFTTVGHLDVDMVEDGHQAIICESLPFETLASDEENGMFVRIHSWDTHGQHVDLKRFLRKKVKITIEVLED